MLIVLSLALCLPEGKSDGTRESVTPPGREAAFIQGDGVWKSRIRTPNRITNAETLRTSVRLLIQRIQIQC